MIIMHTRDQEKEAGIRQIAEEIGEKVLMIGGRELDRTLIGLCTGREQRKETKLPPLYQMPELIVFARMQDEKLNQFLAKYKATGLPPVALKAITTKYNGSWTIYELIVALQEEMKA